MEGIKAKLTIAKMNGELKFKKIEELNIVNCYQIIDFVIQLYKDGHHYLLLLDTNDYIILPLKYTQNIILNS